MAVPPSSKDLRLALAAAERTAVPMPAASHVVVTSLPDHDATGGGSARPEGLAAILAPNWRCNFLSRCAKHVPPRKATLWLRRLRLGVTILGCCTKPDRRRPVRSQFQRCPGATIRVTLRYAVGIADGSERKTRERQYSSNHSRMVGIEQLGTPADAAPLGSRGASDALVHDCRVCSRSSPFSGRSPSRIRPALCYIEPPMASGIDRDLPLAPVAAWPLS
jgi:hypothetical protein